jgi:integrase
MEEAERSAISSASCLSPPACARSPGQGIGRSEKREGLDLSFHRLRRMAVSLLKDAGVPDAVVMALVSHESSAMSHSYTHVGKEALARAAKTLPEIEIIIKQ